MVLQLTGEPREQLRVRLYEWRKAGKLLSLHESEAFSCLSFVGGTALRFAFELPLFSEVLAFSLEASDGYDPVRCMQKLKRDFMFAGFDVSVSWNDRKTVHTSWIKVAGLLQEVGLSAMSDQKISIKVEIDSNPPQGARTVRTVLNRHLMFALQHHNLESLMTGKLHALMTRKYAKGRDWYDLIWYLSRRPPTEPNRTLLQHQRKLTAGHGRVGAKTLALP